MWKKKSKEEKKPKIINNLIEYFYLFGIDPDLINVEKFDKEQKFLKKGYHNADLLSKFPPDEKAGINIDIKVIKNHCFPNGFKLVARNGNPVEEYFYFSLENMISSDTNDKKLNFSCVLFYEPLTKYVKIKNLRFRIKNKITENENQKENQKKKNLKNQKKDYPIDNLFVPKVLCISSFLAFPNEFKCLLSKLINYSKSDKIVYPIEKIIENMIYGIPRPPRAYFDIHCKKKIGFFPKQDFELDFRLPELNEYYGNSFKFQSILNFSVEDIIDIYKSLLLEVPILFFCSKKELLTNLFESFLTLIRPFECQVPNVAILPDMNAGIIDMAKSFFFGINHEWVIPGNTDKKQTYFQKFNLNIINKKILICDVDNHKIYKYFNNNKFQHIINFNDLGVYPVSEGVDPSLLKSKEINNDCFNNWNQYTLPEHYTKKLKKKLKAYIEKNSNMSIEYNEKTNKELGEQTFYYYLASIFQSYNDFVFKTQEEVVKICKELLTKDLQDINIETLFDVKGFINVNNKDNSFYIKFFETKMFKEFLKRKYLFRDCDKYTILHFDEAISAKKNKKWFSKKIKIEFKECKFLKYSKSYVVKQTKDFSKDEYKYIENNKDLLLKYNQQYNKNNELTYIIFPKFLYDNIYFKKKYQTELYYDNEVMYLFEDSNKAIDKLKETNIFSLYSSDFANLFLMDINSFNINSENENALYLLWLNIFSLTLHYCDENEKEYRYEEMIDHLSRVSLDKNKVINVIIPALAKYGDAPMMIRFFENLNPFYYSGYSYLTSKFLNEKKMVSDLKKMNIANSRFSINYHESKIGINIFDFINNKGTKTLKPRTFEINTKPSPDPKDNPNIPTKETVFFDDTVKCEKCNKDIELGVITIAFNDMNREGKLKCQECHNFISPKINVQYGENVDTITLYGIYYLYNISKELIKKYGNKVDMDELRSEYKDFFWNCIWFFGLKGLSYDMLLKYKFINYYSIGNDNNPVSKKKCFSNLEFQRQVVQENN